MVNETFLLAAHMSNNYFTTQSKTIKMINYQFVSDLQKTFLIQNLKLLILRFLHDRIRVFQTGGEATAIYTMDRTSMRNRGLEVKDIFVLWDIFVF